LPAEALAKAGLSQYPAAVAPRVRLSAATTPLTGVPAVASLLKPVGGPEI